MTDFSQAAFIRFMLDCGALRFGAFTTKSGRATPYFINTGAYDDGAKLARLAAFYSHAIRQHFDGAFDVLYGPAYKGIPLAVAIAMRLSEETGTPVPFAFNRKEAKDHGEGGSLVGASIGKGTRVLIVEDVTTAGTSVHESMRLLRDGLGAKVVGLVVSVDRQERGSGGQSALAELAALYGLRTAALVTLDDLIAHLPHDRLEDPAGTLEAIRRYREEFGARP